MRTLAAQTILIESSAAVVKTPWTALNYANVRSQINSATISANKIAKSHLDGNMKGTPNLLTFIGIDIARHAECPGRQWYRHRQRRRLPQSQCRWCMHRPVYMRNVHVVGNLVVLGRNDAHNKAFAPNVIYFIHDGMLFTGWQGQAHSNLTLFSWWRSSSL